MWGIPIFKELAQLFLKHYVGQQSLPVGCQFACSVLDRVIVPHCICLSFPANSLSPCLPVTAALSKLWHELRKTHTYLWPCDSHLSGTSGPVTQLGRSYSSQHAPSAEVPWVLESSSFCLIWHRSLPSRAHVFWTHKGVEWDESVHSPHNLHGVPSGLIWPLVTRKQTHHLKEIQLHACWPRVDGVSEALLDSWDGVRHSLWHHRISTWGVTTASIKKVLRLKGGMNPSVPYRQSVQEFSLPGPQFQPSPQQRKTTCSA